MTFMFESLIFFQFMLKSENVQTFKYHVGSENVMDMFWLQHSQMEVRTLKEGNWLWFLI